MTIAAGIVCSDGILVCADSEVSIQPSKRHREKIYYFENHLQLTGSGNGDFIKMAFDKLCDEYRSARPVNRSDARQIAESLVFKIHKKHIFSFYQPSDSNRPMIDLLIACRCQDNELALVRTRDTTAVLCDGYEATGSGEDLFEYWAQLFYKPEMTMDTLSYLMLFVLREVKRNVMGCGGESHVVWLPKDENAEIVRRFFDDEKILAGFPETAVEILANCRDLNVSDGQFEYRLTKFVNAVRAIRETEKQKSGMEKFIKEHQKRTGLSSDQK